MRHRNTASARAASDAASSDLEPKHGAKGAQELGGRAVAVLVGSVTCLPVLLWLVLKWVLPSEDHAKLTTAPKLQLGLDAEDVLANLRNHTLLHIGGVHRSGTTILWKGLGLHKSVSKLEFQPGHDSRHAHWIQKTMNEGIFLQTVYPKFGLDHKKFLIRKWVGQFLRRVPFLPEGALPWMRLREGIGRFALHPDHHLSEASPLVHEQSQQRLFNQWALFWDLSRPVLMEKSPSNGVIAPFLHRLWGLGLPSSPTRLVFMQRHPIAVAMATQWAAGITVSDLSIVDLVDNWVAAEERRAEDLRQYFSLHEDPAAPAVHRTVTLEELSREPRRVLGDLLGWLGLAADEETLDAFDKLVTPDPNLKYFQLYCVRLLDRGEEVLREHTVLLDRFADRVLAVSPYDLRQVPDLCKDALIQLHPAGTAA